MCSWFYFFRLFVLRLCLGSSYVVIKGLADMGLGSPVAGFFVFYYSYLSLAVLDVYQV